jgi:hypothetical protein
VKVFSTCLTVYELNSVWCEFSGIRWSTDAEKPGKGLGTPVLGSRDRAGVSAGVVGPMCRGVRS